MRKNCILTSFITPWKDKVTDNEGNNEIVKCGVGIRFSLDQFGTNILCSFAGGDDGPTKALDSLAEDERAGQENLLSRL
jgi:hypothetical protein